MSLRGAPLMYLFVDVHGLPRQRELLETVVGLPVIEIEPHLPHHRHGAVKYDTGPLIFSLNLSSPGKFRPERSDALVTVFTVDPALNLEPLRAYGRLVEEPGGFLFTDPSGHHYLFRPPDERSELPEGPLATELRLAVEDLGESVCFYGEVLDLGLLEHAADRARFATGGVDLVLEPRDTAVDGRAPDRRTCLVVFYTPELETARTELESRGVDFGNRRGAFSEIGGTARFDDPSGHRFCLYQPSAESLSWESGPKVKELAAGAAAR
jgi:predicted enzyme related to lactoylglutathione lyase